MVINASEVSFLRVTLHRLFYCCPCFVILNDGGPMLEMFQDFRVVVDFLLPSCWTVGFYGHCLLVFQNVFHEILDVYLDFEVG